MHWKLCRNIMSRFTNGKYIKRLITNLKRLLSSFTQKLKWSAVVENNALRQQCSYGNVGVWWRGRKLDIDDDNLQTCLRQSSHFVFSNKSQCSKIANYFTVNISICLWWSTALFGEALSLFALCTNKLFSWV